MRAVNRKDPHLESVFNAALEKEGQERSAYLDGACGADAGLRDRVEALLAAHDQAGSFLRGPALGEATIDLPALERPGTRIGHYKLLQVIGEGGFGAVYMAEQEKPVRRKVALKIIKLGMDTKQVIARFEAERQALAMMDHTNIARVFDAGATVTGRPYFVMELVKGVPITEYCDTNKLTTRERLGLFTDVCRAVQHAHQKGIIHRDIKPSNVLVTLHDSRPVPKVIDFGIAKATSHRLTEKTLFTEFRQLIGTPEYMSPDQAEISGLDVDTRTDVYSLGVLLYELLTGTTPFDAKTLRSMGYGEIQRIIREEEPPKPSTRVVTLAGQGSSGADIARHRHTDPKSLSRVIRGDLDWIVMKAMEKDRTRRFQSAGELADDVQRHLDDKPVLAGPPSVGYKLAKFIRRHRYSVTAGSLIAAALVAGLSLSTVGFVRASREAARTRAVNDFLSQLTTQLQVAGGGDELSVGEILARGRALFGDDHAVIGTLLQSRASSLQTAGRLDDAIEAERQALALHRRAQPGDHPNTAAALALLGTLLDERADYAESESVTREALAMKERLFGDGSERTADQRSALVALLKETGDANRNEEIRQLWIETAAAYAAALGPSHRKTVIEQCQLGKWLFEHGYTDEAEPVLTEAVERARDVLGDDLNRFVALNSLGQLHYVRGEPAKVIPLVEEMIVLAEASWGRGHPVWSHLTVQQIAFLSRAGRRDDAARRLEAYLEARASAEASACDGMLLGLEEQLGKAMERDFDERPDLGRAFLLMFLSHVKEVVGSDQGRRAEGMAMVGSWMIEHGFDADAEPILREALSIRREALPQGHWQIGSAASMLGESIAGQGRYAEAEPLLVEGQAVLNASPDTTQQRRQEAAQRLADLYEAWSPTN